MGGPLRLALGERARFFLPCQEGLVGIQRPSPHVFRALIRPADGLRALLFYSPTEGGGTVLAQQTVLSSGVTVSRVRDFHGRGEIDIAVMASCRGATTIIIDGLDRPEVTKGSHEKQVARDDGEPCTAARVGGDVFFRVRVIVASGGAAPSQMGRASQVEAICFNDGRLRLRDTARPRDEGGYCDERR